MVYFYVKQLGKEQHFELGGFFRKRYGTLIGNGTYLREIIYVQSKSTSNLIFACCICGFINITHSLFFVFKLLGTDVDRTYVFQSIVFR